MFQPTGQQTRLAPGANSSRGTEPSTLVAMTGSFVARRRRRSRSARMNQVRYVTYTYERSAAAGTSNNSTSATLLLRGLTSMTSSMSSTPPKKTIIHIPNVNSREHRRTRCRRWSTSSRRWGNGRHRPADRLPACQTPMAACCASPTSSMTMPPSATGVRRAQDPAQRTTTTVDIIIALGMAERASALDLGARHAL